MVVVEVRQGTLGVDGRGWGPAGHTDMDRSGAGGGRGGRGGRRGGGGEEEERRTRQEEEATDIKSNNPHLAGGEKLEQICFGR